MKENIDICIISPSLLETGTVRGGGAEVTDYNVALQLAKQFKVVVLCPFYKNYLGEIKVNDNFYIWQIPFPAQRHYPPRSNFESHKVFILTYLYSILLSFYVLTLIAKRLKFIIVHNPQTGLLSAIIAKLMRLNLIYSEGNIVPWTNPYADTPKSKLQEMVENYNFALIMFMCKISDSIRVQSRSIGQGMIQLGIDFLKINVISTGIDINEFKPISTGKNRSDSIRVGFVGRLTEIKGVPMLLDVVNKCAKKLPKAKFFIFGDGPYKNSFMKLPNVVHVGSVKRDELNSCLADVDLVLFFQTELGRAEVESMAAGKAIIAMDVGEVSKFLKHLDNGFLCPPYADSYVEAISYLYMHPKLMIQLGKRARDTAVDGFNWDLVGSKWISLFNKLICESQ